MQTFRASPFFKLQNNTWTTVKQWKMRCRIPICFCWAIFVMFVKRMIFLFKKLPRIYIPIQNLIWAGREKGRLLRMTPGQVSYLAHDARTASLISGINTVCSYPVACERRSKRTQVSVRLAVRPEDLFHSPPPTHTPPTPPTQQKILQ